VRILIATLSPDLIGGVEKYLQMLIPALARRGHSVGLLYQYPFTGSAQFIDPGLDLPAWCSGEMGVDSVLESIKTWAPDIVYSQGLDDEALESGLLNAYPVALYAHTYWGTCVTGKKCHSLPRIEPCGRRLGPGCLLMYYPRRCGGLNPRTMWQLFQIESQRKTRLSRYHAVLVASRHMYREYERHGAAPRVVALPIDDSLPGISAPPLKDPGDRILYVGRLIDVKGVDLLLRAIPAAAAALGRSLHLTVAGDGPDRAALENMARTAGLRVEFTGWIDNARRSELMRHTDLLAVPSLWPEPFGMVGLEAGRFGVPAAGFAVGGIPDWLIAGETGELAPGDPPTVEGLAQAMTRALADPGHYRKLCAGAWRMAREFSLERHLVELEQVLGAPASTEQLLSSGA